MSKINANDIRVGNVIYHKNALWEVLKVMHTQPGKGGAFIQAEMKDLIKKSKINERFRSSENIEKAILDEEEYQYLYKNDSDISIMNNSTYEQLEIPLSLLGDKVIYLQDGIIITVLSYNGKWIKAKVPKHLTFSVSETEATIKGQTAAASYKPATLENGLVIAVPPFIKAGDKIIINTEDNSYVERDK